LCHASAPPKREEIAYFGGRYQLRELMFCRSFTNRSWAGVLAWSRLALAAEILE
jgi:hypothetical protein